MAVHANNIPYSPVYDIVIDDILHKTDDQISIQSIDHDHNTIPKVNSLTMYRDVINETKTTNNQNICSVYGVDEDKAAF